MGWFFVLVEVKGALKGGQGAAAEQRGEGGARARLGVRAVQTIPQERQLTVCCCMSGRSKLNERARKKRRKAGGGGGRRLQPISQRHFAAMRSTAASPSATLRRRRARMKRGASV